MSSEIVKTLSKEERELEKRLKQLARLESILADRELELATIQAELRVFEAQYIRIVGIRYSELDEIEAQISEARASFNPTDQEAQEQARWARTQAEESSQGTKSVEKSEEGFKFSPSERLKKLFRKIAKQIHPDLAADEIERSRRHRIMTAAILAYKMGDEERLRAILRDWEISPESVKGRGPMVELSRVKLKIAQVEERLKWIDVEISSVNKSDLFQLKSKTDEVARKGRDLLAEMVAQLDQRIADARERLKRIKHKQDSL